MALSAAQAVTPSAASGACTHVAVPSCAASASSGGGVAACMPPGSRHRVGASAGHVAASARRQRARGGGGDAPFRLHTHNQQASHDTAVLVTVLQRDSSVARLARAQLPQPQRCHQLTFQHPQP
jgi:hypothetical protein